MLVLGLIVIAGCVATPIRVTVQAPPYGLPATPLCVTVAPCPAKLTPCRLVSDDGARSWPAQWERTPNGARLWFVPQGVQPGETVTLKLVPRPPARSPRAQACEDDSSVELVVRGDVVTRYLAYASSKPFCFPLIGPTGLPVTRNYPTVEGVEGESTDHPHHESLWFTFGAVNGVDFWSKGEGKGRIAHKGFTALDSGPVFALLQAENDWLGPDGTRICADTRTLRVYDTPGVVTLDFEITITATDGDVTFGDTKEGMMACRVADTMRADAGGTIVNSEGLRNAEAWGKRARWCDYSGPLSGETVGIAILDSPDNFRHPTYWHVRTYGLFAANPFGLHDYLGPGAEDGSLTIPAGGTLAFAYRFVIHRGSAEEAGIESLWQLYASPPVSW